MMSVMILLQRFRRTVSRRDEKGFTTAELLGNAALAVAALGVIWIGMQGLGQEVMDYIRNQLIK